MNKFQQELKNGNFVVSECINCKQVVWPTSNYCNLCHNKTTWRNAKKTGKVIEFSKKNDEYFGLVEIEENLRIMGKILGNEVPIIEQVVHIENCSFAKTPEFTFKLISN